MQFCTQHSKTLDGAFASLSYSEARITLPIRDSATVAAQLSDTHRQTPACSSKGDNTRGSHANDQTSTKSAEELSTILTALRKLREGILASSNSASSPLFSQRVHIFNIRLAILALHPDSYHASLRYLLGTLHTREHPLPLSELQEMTSYLILDTALRLEDVNEAQVIRAKARSAFNFVNRDVDDVLRAVVSHNWPLFWRVRRRVDGYLRAIMYHHIEALRKRVLKVIAKSYMKCDIKWIVQSTTGGEMDWDQLIVQENIGWLRDRDVAIIRKPKVKR